MHDKLKKLNNLSRSVVVETRYGPMTFYSDDQYIGRALEKYGEYSQQEVKLWADLISEGDHVVDVGANIGALTLALADLVTPEGAVHAFEPHPELFTLLARNIEGSPHINAYQYALGSSKRRGFVKELADLGHNNYGDVVLDQPGRDLLVEVTTLDSYQLDSISFIKIDVQGMEADVLNGARDTIRKYKPIIQVEIDQPIAAQKTLKVLRELGYRCYEHNPFLFDPENYLNDQENIWPGVVSKNAICFAKHLIDDDVLDKHKLIPIVPITPRAGKTGWAGVCRFGGVGDNLMAASVLRPLKNAGYKIEVLTQEPQSVVFENNPFIDKLAIKGKTDLPQGNQLAWQDWFRSRANEYDLFANLSHTCEVSLALIPSQTQYWWPTQIRRKLCNKSYLELVHDVFGMPYEFGRMFFPTDEEQDAAALRKRSLPGIKAGQPVIGWVLTGTRIDKIYPQAAMAVGRIIRELDCHVVLMGAPQPSSDFTFAKGIQSSVIGQNGDDRGLHLALSPTGMTTWPIRRILSLAQICDLVVGPDTGPMWAVAMEEMPKIVLLSHASPENITKHWIKTVTLHADQQKTPCWPCHLLHDTKDTCLDQQRRSGLHPTEDVVGAACISDISVETIIRTAADQLGV